MSPHPDPTSSSASTTTSSAAVEHLLLRLPSTTVHLLHPHSHTLPLASGPLDIIQLTTLNNNVHSTNTVAVLARIGSQIQWPLAKDEPSFKISPSHYLFSLRVPGNTTDTTVLNYGVTVSAAAAVGEDLVVEFDRVLEQFSCFEVRRVEGDLDLDLELERWLIGEEEYGGRVARVIAAGSGELAKGIVWCGGLTVDGLKWGNGVLKGRLGEKKEEAEVAPELMERIKMVEKVTKMTEKIASEVLSGVAKVTGCVTSSIVNSEAGKRFLGRYPGEIVVASLDAFNKVFDAVEAAGKSVMSTTSVVTTELVSERYGDQAAQATNVGLGAAGHAIAIAWAIFNVRKAINLKSVMKPTTLDRAAADAGLFDTMLEGA